MKICNDCLVEKSKADFHKKGKGLQPYCKDCTNRHQREKYLTNKEKSSARKKVIYLRDKTKILAKNKQWRDGNKERIKLTGKVYRKENANSILARNRTYRENNRLKVNEYDSMYRRERCKKDLNYKIRNGLRSRLSVAIKNNQKTGSAVQDLGCSISELIMYLESKFQFGMSWENYGKKGWHIDHILPLFHFDLNDRNQFLQACHFTNLQPLWEEDNLRKGAKLL